MSFLLYSIEDDKDIALIINRTLTHSGYCVKTFSNGKDFLYAFSSERPDMILLDIKLPDINGLELLKHIRSSKENDDIDIIIISANDMVIDKVDGLDLGADDYIEKPFDLLELISRVNARLRKHKKNNIIICNDLKLNIDTYEFFYKNNLVHLTNKEFEIIKLLMIYAGKTISRNDILTNIWNNNSFDLESRTVDMHIKSLRKKINDEEGKVIKTVYGIGYMIK